MESQRVILVAAGVVFLAGMLLAMGSGMWKKDGGQGDKGNREQEGVAVSGLVLAGNEDDDDDDDDDEDGNGAELLMKGNRAKRRRRTWSVLCAAGSISVVLLYGFHFFLTQYEGLYPPLPHNPLTHPSTNAISPLTQNDSLKNVFQVYRPPLSPPPSTNPSCTLLLMSHTFAFSYGHPYIGAYSPPAGCPFNAVTMTLTVSSSGRQFDRLALMFLGDVEVLRTSTAEPTVNGIVWSYTKDMTSYLALWRRRQKVVFDLGNLVDDRYTGSFEATLVATFWEGKRREGGGGGGGRERETADLILPISARRAAMNESSAFRVPGDDARVNLAMPAGVTRAIVSIAACGQMAEEFWYSNVLEADTGTFRNTTGELYGFSPFREVQLLIDGYLAGVVWPFPIIFTGGIAPRLWRPIVGIDAFDLREPEIDITPWLSWLTDGKEHQFQIRVVGLDGTSDDLSLSKGVGDYWVVTGKILIFLDEGRSGQRIVDDQYLPSIFAPEPVIKASSKVTMSASGTNETLSYSVMVSRTIVVTSEAGSWVQILEYTNENLLTSEGLSQSTTQHIKVDSAALNFRNPALSFGVSSSYPLSINTTIAVLENDTGITIEALLFHGLEIESTGRPDGSLFTLAPGRTRLSTSQHGTAHYSSQPNRSYSFGDTTQDFFESSEQGISMVHVQAVNGSVVPASGDTEQHHASMDDVETHSAEDATPHRSLREVVGRGR